MDLRGLLLILACGGKDRLARRGGAAGRGGPASDLTPWEMEHGIGPVKEPLALGPVEHELAEDGEELRTKCTACHGTDQRYVGRRSAASPRR
jgi:hypothetical protein